MQRIKMLVVDKISPCYGFSGPFALNETGEIRVTTGQAARKNRAYWPSKKVETRKWLWVHKMRQRERRIR